ncbi:conserved hypothetical protein [Mesorhizobium delmotii]|uniref:Uncharacterized protein n=1 Tax=Mesorhizobium delmotii TaxID=1631247 RepID=A0A2P9AT50_9HYPH|nr:conserved hypothetical protein [Mesorhizobium delmotii]
MARAFEDRSADSFPALAVSWGKCRVGSTVLTNLFAIVGLPSYYQPARQSYGSRRWVSVARAGRAQWRDKPLVRCKEMTGPYLLAECLFDPIELLVAGGSSCGRDYYDCARLPSSPASDHRHLLLASRAPVES